MANQTTLTFAGDTAQLERSFSTAGAAADAFGNQAADASRRMADGFDYASSQSSMLSGGIGDVGGALTEAFGEDTAIGEFGAKMEQAGTIIMGVTGVMDLALFATNNLRLASAAHAIQSGITAGATRAWAGAQMFMNAAIWASPVTWIVAGIIALVAVIVLIATKTNWFQTAWRNTWKWVTTAARNSWDYVKRIPGWIGNAFSRVGSYILAPYRAAFNGIARAWNSTVGQLSWSVPGWVPGIGGNSISVPHLPTFHSGVGVVPGVRGTPTVALLQAGERVNSIGSSSGGGELVLRGDDRVGDALVEIIALAMRRRRGGDPAALGIRTA